MGQKIEEQLSALLDAELALEEEELLLRRLAREPEYRAVLGRYSLIGELLRDARADPAALQIGERIRTEITAEIAHTGSVGWHAGRASGWSKRWRGMGRGLFGAGIAAAVAAIAVTAVFNLNSAPRFEPVLASVESSYTVPIADTGRGFIMPSRLTGYLVSHQEFSSALSRRAMDAYIVRQSTVVGDWNLRTIAEDE